MKNVPEEIKKMLKEEFSFLVTNALQENLCEVDLDELEVLAAEHFSIVLDRNSTLFPNNEVSEEAIALKEYLVEIFVDLINKSV